jgi:hypothetical protein
VDELSGPMFQRRGTKLFTAAELQPEINRLYGHLPEARRKSLARQLTAADRGTPGDQQGQKVVRVRPFTETFNEPASLAEAASLFRKEFRDNKFRPERMVTNLTTGTGGIDLEMTFIETKHPRNADPFDATMTITATRLDDTTIIKNGRANINNPDRYQWRIERKHERSGRTTLTALGERVVAYLHHGSLDAARHEHFGRPESDPDFYATSRFTPPPPPAPPAGSSNTRRHDTPGSRPHPHNMRRYGSDVVPSSCATTACNPGLGYWEFPWIIRSSTAP